MTNQNNNKRFYCLVNGLEKYIEKAGFYSDWEQRKQIVNNIVKREDMNGSKKEDKLDFLVVSLQFFDFFVSKEKPSLKQFKSDFYKWINATGITAENCPFRLKLVLFGICEILDGRSEKLIKEVENRKREIEPDSPEYQKWMEKIFSEVSNHLGEELPSGEFKGDTEAGKETFQKIAGSISPTDYENFHWCPQKEEIPTDNTSDAQKATTELKKLLDRANQLEKKGSSTEIKKIISELEQFKNNTAAHNEKNNYAWQKLNGGGKIAELKIALKIRDFRGEDCSDCQEISELQLKLIAKKNELENAEQENKSSAEIEKIKQEIADLEAEIACLASPQKTTQNPKNGNAKYWISGIVLVVLIGLFTALIMAKKRRNKKNDSKK
ncbi:MAG: hypothetical protein I3273_04850 [Candidatus Moeniiplasma glomeromycotorum]|nr:hypothetical protein [Candidatus Moeniiplasma glomeromycotorum]MCE8169420.1 hypothetical protein [Candidatus Moeniiplasma glomeromycotorum]